MLIKFGLLGLMLFLSYRAYSISEEEESVNVNHIAAVAISIILSIVLILSNTNIFYSLVQISGIVMLLVSFNAVLLFKKEKLILAGYSFAFVVILMCLICSFPFSTFVSK